MRILLVLALLTPFLFSCQQQDVKTLASIEEMKARIDSLEKRLEPQSVGSGKDGVDQLMEGRLAIVDLDRLTKEYKGMVSAQNQLERQFKKWSTELEAEGKAFAEEYKKAENLAQYMTEEQVQRKGLELQQKQQKLVQKEQELKMKAAEQQATLIKETLTKVNTHLKRYALENGYRCILATPIENSVFYADDQIDITDDYIEALNASGGSAK